MEDSNERFLGTLTLPLADFSHLPDQPEEWDPVTPEQLIHNCKHLSWQAQVPGTNQKCKDLANDLLRLLRAEEVDVKLWAGRRGEHAVILVQLNIPEEGLHLGSSFRAAFTRIYKCLREGDDGFGDFISIPSVSGLLQTE
jgi:hypothetical protein